MTPIYERVYIGRDNYTEIGLSGTGCRADTLDFTDTTRMVLTLTPADPDSVNPALTVDSDVLAAAIDWTTGGQGSVRFTLGDVVGAVADEQYDSQLVAYDALHPDGQVLIDGELPRKLVFTFYEV